MLGFMRIRHDGALARSLPRPIRGGIESFRPPDTGISARPCHANTLPPVDPTSGNSSPEGRGRLERSRVHPDASHAVRRGKHGKSLARLAGHSFPQAADIPTPGSSFRISPIAGVSPRGVFEANEARATSRPAGAREEDATAPVEPFDGSRPARTGTT